MAITRVLFFSTGDEFYPCLPSSIGVYVDFASVPERSSITRFTIRAAINGHQTIIKEANYTGVQTGVYVSETPWNPAYADRYNPQTVYIVIDYYKSGEYGDLLVHTDEYQENNVRGNVGELGTPLWESAYLQFTVINKHTIELVCTENEYSASFPGNALVRRDSGRAIEWYFYTRSGDLISLSGMIENQVLEADPVIEHTLGESNHRRKSTLRVRFKKTGEYWPAVTMNYSNFVDCRTYSVLYANTGYIRVYNPAKPTIVLDSVSPDEYKSGDSDPMNGRPPYTVVIRDITATSDPDQIPQESISFDFGDPASGHKNKTLIQNSTSGLITAPDQTHTYAEYGPYVIQIAISDKNKDTTTYSISFAPSKTPRLIKSPTLTPLAGNQPLLIEGAAYIAGDPLPATNWEYQLQASGSEYYSGEKSGEFVEFSLLAGGTYVVTCETTNGDTPIDTTTFSVDVNPQQIYNDDPVPLQNFELIVYDRGTGLAADRCRQHTTPTYTQNYGKRDTFSLQIPRTYPYQQLMVEGDTVAIGYLGQARLMQITFRSRNDETISISGYECSPPQRVALISTRSTSGNGYDVQKCSAEALLRYFVTTNLRTPGAETNYRGAPEFRVVGENQDRGGRATYSARYETTQAILEELCSSYGLGWSATLQRGAGRVVGWGVVEGADRTRASGENAVIFSEQLKNCRFGNDQGSLTDNVAVGAGAGAGATREYTFYGSTSASGFGRREMFIDAGDAADADEIARMCNLALERAKQLTISLLVLPTCQWTFGVDYRVGDFVTVDHPDRGSLDLRIVSATVARRESGDELELTLGYDPIYQPTLIRRTQQENSYARR